MVANSLVLGWLFIETGYALELNQNVNVRRILLRILPDFSN